MGQFDQTARPIAKLDGAAFLAWALWCLRRAPRLTFLNWDDTRRLVVPGEPERTNDLVAQVRDEDRPARQTWLVVEIEDEAEPGICWRMGQYGITLGREVNPRCEPDGPAVGTLVVNLSGTQRARHVEPAFRGGHGTGIRPLIVDAAAQDAARTLRRIEKGELGLTILPFLSLMQGSGTTAFIERWKAAVEREKDEGRRLAYKDWALILAELTGHEVDWLKATEGWMQRKSKIIEGWKKEGAEEAELRLTRKHLLRVLTRLRDPVPEPVRRAIEGSNDPAKLEQWFDAATEAASFAAFCRVMGVEG
jgi:hypothetical protein